MTLIATAKQLIRDRFEGNNGDALAFHNTVHTDGVMRRTRAILETIRAVRSDLVTEHDLLLGDIASAYHDTVQYWDSKEMTIRLGDGRFTKGTKRIRRAGKGEGRNEYLSIQEAVTRMDGEFTNYDRDMVRLAIEATVPGWSMEHMTVIQPELTVDSHPVVRALALSDLGVSGMDGADFRNEAPALFVEENLDVITAITEARTRADLDSRTVVICDKDGNEIGQDKATVVYRQRMLDWYKSQLGFAKGRKARLELELGNLPEDAKVAVRALFGKFDAAIETATQVVIELEAMDFYGVAQATGYKVPLN